MGLTVGRQGAGKVGRGAPSGQSDFQQPLRGDRALAGGFAGIGQGVQRQHALAVVLLARFGEAELAAAAVEQLGLQVVFQMAHMLAGHGDGNAQDIGSAGETAVFYHLAEHGDALQSVDKIFFLGNNASIKMVSFSV